MGAVMKKILILAGLMLFVNFSVFAEDLCFSIDGINQFFDLSQNKAGSSYFTLYRLKRNAKVVKKFDPITFRLLKKDEQNSEAIKITYGSHDGRLYINENYPGPGVQFISVHELKMKFVSGKSVINASQNYPRWCMKPSNRKTRIKSY